MESNEAQGRFTALFEAHSGAVLSYARRRAPRPDDAADVVAETFLVAWRRLAEVPAGDEARAWLFGIGRRVLANQRRGDRRRDDLGIRLAGALQELDPCPPDESPDIDPIRQALSRLSDG